MEKFLSPLATKIIGLVLDLELETPYVYYIREFLSILEALKEKDYKRVRMSIDILVEHTIAEEEKEIGNS